MALKDWSTTAGSNNSASPNGFPEGMAPSGVNNAAREVMAQVRGWYEDPAWINYGYTYTYVGATQFKISGQDVTAKYVVGRRVRAVGVATGTIYGRISVSSFSTDTTVTVVWDSGSLSNEALEVSTGIPSLGKPVPYNSLSLTGAVLLADMADLSQATIIGRALGAGTGVPTALSAAQVASIVQGSLTLVAASQIFAFSMFIQTPTNQAYRVLTKSPIAFTINSITTICTSGTCTLTGKIDTVALGGTANSVSSVESEQTHSSANSVSVGSDIDLTVSANSSCSGLAATVKYTRTLA